MIYQEHHFSIFMRSHRRSSDAGFPTKLAESLAAETPVLADKTGDIPYYIENGKNGFVVENEANELKKMISILNRKSFMYIKESNLDNWEENKEMDKLLDLSKGFNAYIFFILRAIKVLRMRLRL